MSTLQKVESMDHRFLDHSRIGNARRPFDGEPTPKPREGRQSKITDSTACTAKGTT
jgi:hypothetical protein